MTTTTPRWDRTWLDSQASIADAQSAIRSHSRARLPVQRINILEASVLDSEIFNLLEMSFATVFGGARAMEQSAGPTSTWRRLLGLGIRLAVTGATVATNSPTPGQVLQSVRYRNERMFQDARTAGVLRLPKDGPTRTQRFLWMLLNVLLPYCWSSIRYRITRWLGAALRNKRDRDAAVEVDNNDNYDNNLRRLKTPEVVVGKWLDVLEASWGVASLVNMLIFFRNGVYTTLEDRLLRMRQVPLRGGGGRVLNFDFQNRQIVFSELNDFAIYMLPMLRVYSTMREGRRMGARFIGRLRRLGRHVGVLSSVVPPTHALQQQQQQGEKRRKVEDCSYCGESPASTPYVTSCGCTMCFYCLRTRVDPVGSAGGGSGVEASCPSCSQRMKWSKRWEELFGGVEEEEEDTTEKIGKQAETLGHRDYLPGR